MFVTAELRVRHLSNLPSSGFFKPVYRTNHLSQLRISHELSNRSSGTGFTYLKGQRVFSVTYSWDLTFRTQLDQVDSDHEINHR